MPPIPLKWSESHSVVSNSLQPHGLYSPWNSPGQNTGMGSLSLLQGIFPTQGLNPGLLHCRWILYQLSHKGSPRILERVAYPFSRGSSRPRNQTGVSCIAGRFFTNWAIREDIGWGAFKLYSSPGPPTMCRHYSSSKGRFPVEVVWQGGSGGLDHPSSSEFSVKSEMLPLAPQEFPLPFLLWSMNCLG